MGKFNIVNKVGFPLPNTRERFWHIATIEMQVTQPTHGVRTFMYFSDTRTGETYVEELVGTKPDLVLIEDDALWFEICRFVQLAGLNTFINPKYR